MADPDAGRRLVEELMFGGGTVRRFTQDSPVLPDVWIRYFNARKKDEKRVELLLTPDRETTPGELARELRDRLKTPHGIAYNASTVAVTLTFEELVREVLPLTKWWWENLRRGQELLAQLDQDKARQLLAKAVVDPERRARELGVSVALLWMVRVVGMLALRFYWPTRTPAKVPKKEAEWRPAINALAQLLHGTDVAEETDARIFSISLNRPARASIDRSALAIKADAARRLFNISCDKLTWAIVDSGIDAEHPAFRLEVDGKLAPAAFEEGKRPSRTRVVATYDFSRVRDFLDPDQLTEQNLKALLRRRDKSQGKAGKSKGEKDAATPAELLSKLEDLRKHLLNGRSVDWSLLEPFLEVPHERDRYQRPTHDHGTHVAGILGADWRDENDAAVLTGICPDIRFYDLRVLDENGAGDEFSVIAALQFIRHVNSQHDYMVLQGANLSLSLRHDVANYACGRTPVCEECDRLAGAGVVVVAAAGNLGYERVHTAEGLREGYLSVSITDPGNAESVITVGATHRYKPHTYGVSYFSSRGPTGDGRIKPDLVAPGEKINAPVPGEGQRAKDGTSMAAPHVSGAAALLMARYNELIGEPAQVKAILKSTATDLGRERYFQGAGMLDVLRALQSV